ncbi:GRAM domain-containing protein 2B-like isoform X2 [Dunckerocampus dactyliophorus]|uniref:GRAM domain-containing protein 2B-like isoform X2 n=1 Tax=Dunckerocampus dactyliophorus TaxID=161453 RepID=UPI0024059983|nr:GRAM domain-containing protein 2B-like isoform X2 [Dunckerocampus dactyliophorus]
MVLMGEQAERPLTPPTATEQLLQPRGSRSEAENDAQRRRRRPTDLQLCLDNEPEPCEIRKKTTGTSLNPSEQLSPAPSPSGKTSPSGQLSKTDVHFHKLFKQVGRHEALQQSTYEPAYVLPRPNRTLSLCSPSGYTCALQRDILYQGRMFLSQNWICFHSKVFGRDTKIAIPAASVTFIKKTKTVLLVPNALVIETAREQHVFVSFLSRNATYKFLRSVCVHLEVEKTCGSRAAASCQDSFPAEIPSCLPLRRQEMTESSSSGSQTPDYDKMSDFAGLPFVSAGVKSGEVSVLADVHLHPGPQSKAGDGTAVTLLDEWLLFSVNVCNPPSLEKGHRTEPWGTPSHFFLRQGSPAGEVSQAHKAWPHVTLHSILLIYLFLAGVMVASSCYMAFKMAALEHRLTSMLAAREHVHSQHALGPQDAEIFGELSANLFKLEKIRRNLQKLLDDT